MNGVSPRPASTLLDLSYQPKSSHQNFIVLILMNYKLGNICHVLSATPGSMFDSLPSLRAALKGRAGQGILSSAKENSWRSCLRMAIGSKCQVLASLWSVTVRAVYLVLHTWCILSMHPHADYVLDSQP